MKKSDINPAIVVIAFTRPHALKRLLGSIEKASYERTQINLVISIDGEGNEEIIKIADAFKWKYGKKELIVHKINLGLRDHIVQCGDLTEKFGSVILLEEDCFVSPVFYEYSCLALEFYKNDEKIAGVSLYSYSVNESARLPFSPMIDEFDIYFKQIPSSWGQAWSKNQWVNFKEFYNSTLKINDLDCLPENVKEWPESSWKKYFYKYLIVKNRFFVYPQNSLTTNFGDVGTHYENIIRIWQVNMNMSKTAFNFPSFEMSKNKYDAYCEILPHCIGLEDNVLIDLYGTKQLTLFKEEIVYSVKNCTSPFKTFGLELKPSFLNIIFNIPGIGISCGMKSNFIELSDIKKESLFKDSNEFIFIAGQQNGFKNGREEGKAFIRKSKAFKLGEFLLAPLRFLK